MIKKYLGYVLKFMDLLLMAISPLMVIMFIIAVIMGWDQYGQNARLVRALEQRGQVVTGTVDYISIHSDSMTVSLTGPDGSNVNGYLQLKYYSEEVIQSLRVDDEVSIRYVMGLNDYPIDLVLEDHFDQVRSHWVGTTWQAGIMALISWVVVIFHPEVLFYGFGQEYLDGMQRTLSQ